MKFTLFTLKLSPLGLKGHEISYTLQMINIPNLVKIGPVILRPIKGGGGGGGGRKKKKRDGEGRSGGRGGRGGGGGGGSGVSLDPNSPCDISL